ncbi:unnamed protein product [Caenorhabditis auriculariae]|uniref:Uncharacterized protein n=1 Tax=Caenorhabditis auriculariae TaxID=2777116 RepID=A0A8S1HS24_9PELO|nr:unnamed protein product [Caenorhabditis auriculariae]
MCSVDDHQKEADLGSQVEPPRSASAHLALVSLRLCSQSADLQGLFTIRTHNEDPPLAEVQTYTDAVKRKHGLTVLVLLSGVHLVAP